MATTTARTESLQPLVERLDQLEQRVSRLKLVEPQTQAEEDKARDKGAIEIYEEVTVSSYWLKPARNGGVRSQLTDWPDLPGSTWIGPMGIVDRLTS